MLNVNAQDAAGMTALMHAQGQQAITYKLIKNGAANRDLKDAFGRTYMEIPNCQVCKVNAATYVVVPSMLCVYCSRCMHDYVIANKNSEKCIVTRTPALFFRNLAQFAVDDKEELWAAGLAPGNWPSMRIGEIEKIKEDIGNG